MGVSQTRQQTFLPKYGHATSSPPRLGKSSLLDVTIEALLPLGEDKGKLSADDVSESQDGRLLLTRVVYPELSTWNLFYRTDLRLKAQQCWMESLL